MKCINCSREIDGKGHELRIKNESINAVQTCSKSCLKEVREFQETSKSKQTKLFIILGIGVVLNLGSVSLFPEQKYNYLILALMSICIMVYPYIFIRFRSYQSLGINKTLRNIRVVSGLLCILSLVFYFFI